MNREDGAPAQAACALREGGLPPLTAPLNTAPLNTASSHPPGTSARLRKCAARLLTVSPQGRRTREPPRRGHCLVNSLQQRRRAGQVQPARLTQARAALPLTGWLPAHRLHISYFPNFTALQGRAVSRPRGTGPQIPGSPGAGARAGQPPERTHLSVGSTVTGPGLIRSKTHFFSHFNASESGRAFPSVGRHVVWVAGAFLRAGARYIPRSSGDGV